jgi:MFS family permease
MIGLVSTVFLVSQMAWALLSGVLTDKLGRRMTTLVFDLLCWSVPTLLWMAAQDVRWFLVAALFSGMGRVTETSWGLLLIEDARQDKLMHLYSIMHVAGLVAGFVAPLAYTYVQRFGVVPTMRVLYGLAFVMMTAKFVILFFTTKETSVGLRRMAETSHVGLFQRLWDSRRVLGRMLRAPRTMLTIAFIACLSGVRSVTDAFWPLLITEKLGMPMENLSIFSTAKTLLMLLCYFLIVPRLDLRRFRNPLLTGLALFVAQEMLMLFMPAGATVMVFFSVVLEAVALSLLIPMGSSLQMVNIDREERARMLGFFYAICMLFTAPLGTVAGALAEVNRVLPFALNLLLTLAACLFALRLWRLGLPDEPQGEPPAEPAAIC